VLGGVSNLDITLGGELYNIEEVFPEWSDEEVWTDLPESLKSFQLSYPDVIHFSEQKSPAQLLGLKLESEIETKKGAKKAVKESSLEDAVTSEDGSPLPRVFIGTDPMAGSEQFLSHDLVSSFQRMWTSDQLERKKAMEEAYLASLPTPQAAAPVVVEPPPTSRPPPSSRESIRPASKESKKQIPTRAVSPAMKKAEEEHAAAPVVPPPPTFPELPSGDEIDPFVCHAFRLIARFHPSLCDAHGSGTTPPFLWRAVYPQLPTGRPCYNKSGKYCVKLFVGGKWRKVSVTDCFPVESGMIAIASSTNPLELWPSILSKAIYTVYSASG
jgi:hypothetical protein